MLLIFSTPCCTLLYRKEKVTPLRIILLNGVTSIYIQMIHYYTCTFRYIVETGESCHVYEKVQIPIVSALFEIRQFGDIIFF